MLSAVAVILTRVVNLEDLTGSIAGPIEIPPPVATIDEFISNLPRRGSFWRSYIRGETFDIHPELPVRDDSITRSERQFETVASKAITTTASNDDDNVWDNEDSSSTFAYAGEQGILTQEQIARIEANKKRAAQLREQQKRALPLQSSPISIKTPQTQASLDLGFELGFKLNHRRAWFADHERSWYTVSV